MMNKNVIWLGPVTVLVFVVILAVMYGWVGSVNSVGFETRERPEAMQANQVQLVAGGAADNQADAAKGQPEQPGQLVHHGQFPAGLGNGQIQLINNPTFSAGIGNGQIQLINQNRPGGPYLGLQLSEVPQVVGQDLNIPAGTGLYVNGVVAASPAEKAGASKGDVLLEIAHKTVSTPEEVGRILAGKKAGDVVKLLVNRNGRKKSFQARLENAPLGLDTGAIQNPVWMGADIQDIDTIMKIRFNLPDRRGVIVSHVAANSPASTAGLQNGDVIRRFGDVRIRDVKQLQTLILDAQPGQRVTLTILRDGRNSALEMVMERHAVEPGNVPFLGPADVAIEGSWIGMDVTELAAGDVSAMGLPAGTRGILVADVESPPATMVGFQTGDVITAVSGSPTQDMKQFEAATQQQSGAVVDVIRGNKHLFISVPPPGFTQQGTALNGGMNKMRQVALTRPVGGTLGILAAGPDLNSAVTGNVMDQPCLILVDHANDSYAILGPGDLNSLPDVLTHYHVTALVCSNVSRNTAAALATQGIAVYPGVAGRVVDAIGMYENNQLAAMKGY